MVSLELVVVLAVHNIDGTVSLPKHRKCKTRHNL